METGSLSKHISAEGPNLFPSSGCQSLTHPILPSLKSNSLAPCFVSVGNDCLRLQSREDTSMSLWTFHPCEPDSTCWAPPSSAYHGSRRPPGLAQRKSSSAPNLTHQ